MTAVPFPGPAAGCAYEGALSLGKEEVGRLRETVRTEMGKQFESSLMPAFFEGLLELAPAGDWVDQMVHGRKRVEGRFDVPMQELRLSRTWWTPLFAHLLLDSERFVECYNRALSWYRQEFRVRGKDRPIPDLVRGADRVELPFWVFQRGRPRRRLFTSRSGDEMVLLAEEETVGVLTIDELHKSDDLIECLDQRSGWCVRPRALALTLWARLFLADLFIHGIGGAKYDRITDHLISDYLGLPAPEIACVSATWHLVPQAEFSHSGGQLRHAARDRAWNPQRYLDHDAIFGPWLERRESAIRQSRELQAQNSGDRARRREVFREIRGLTARILDLGPTILGEKMALLVRASQEEMDRRVSESREFFFALFDGASLRELLAALPEVGLFRV